MGEHIDLDRLFRTVTGDDAEEYLDLFGSRMRGHLTWSDVRGRRRVVILAEAGSGKSSEFEHQRDVLAGEGKFAFCATVADVARSSLDGALIPAERKRFEEWKSTQEPCWLLLDSVDEAKDQGEYFETAVRNVANAIVGHDECVHVIISGRYTDWDFKADHKAMVKWLAIAAPPPSPIDFADEVRATLHRNSKPEQPPPPEDVTVLRMSALDAGRVKRFAEASSIADADALLAAIEHGNLWRFASRPLDLAWIVEFWRDNGRLGTLREMIEASLAARLVDPDPRRRKRDPLATDESDLALDRIGASFILCGKDSLRVPTVGFDASPGDKSVPIEKLLPDWADGDRLLLLGRPVFDPATLGRTRLHNDNEGTLRSYLMARWLGRLLGRKCPVQAVKDLLFADLYGHHLVRPEMTAVAAWLAGSDAVIAEELIARDPILLLREGDPGSLPIPTRVKAFGATLNQVADIDREKLWFMDAGLRRFADPGLDPHIDGWWKTAKDEEARHLILRLIQSGRQQGGLFVARNAAFDMATDYIAQLLGCRALFAIGEPEDNARFAAHVVANFSRLHRSIVLEALHHLFPRYISVDEFFVLVDAVGVMDDSGTPSILPLGSDLPSTLHTPDDLQSFLGHVVKRAGGFEDETQREEHPFAHAFAELSFDLAARLLAFNPDAVPDVVTDAVLLLHKADRYRSAGDSLQILSTLFNASAGRRRTSFWRAVERLRDHPWVHDIDGLNIWMLQHLGCPIRLEESDIDWLLVDARERSEADERTLALRTAHGLWRDNGGAPEKLVRIGDAVAHNEALAEALATWCRPQPENAELTRQTERLQKLEARNRQHTEKRDNSWVELVATLRDDPTVMDRLNPQTENTVDSRLYHLWKFLSWRSFPRGRHAIDNLEGVEPVLGPDLTRRLGGALTAFAFQRLGEEAQLTRENAGAGATDFDLMALTGVALAEAADPAWATKLSDTMAARIAWLAAIEINGFPKFLNALAAARPEAVRKAFTDRITKELRSNNPDAHRMLDRLEYADEAIAKIVADDLVEMLESNPGLPAFVVEKIASVLVRGLPKDSGKLRAVAANLLDRTSDPDVAGYLLLLQFATDGEAAVTSLRAKMSKFDRTLQTSLCCTLLPRLAGDRFTRSIELPSGFTAAGLEQLLVLAFEGVRLEEDIERPNGGAYSPNERDAGQDARNAIFNRLAETPGEATYSALMRLAAIADFPIKPEWLSVHARRRAVKDAELAAWQPSDVITFERTYDRPPATTADLLLTAKRRLEAITHDLTEGKFQQGDTLQMLPDENSVQRWVATQLDERRLEAYTVQRETHVADEKEPDITLVSRHSGVELPIEIKVADGMSVPQLEAALETQLCGQYLRHDTARHGILLIVHQHARAGWNLIDGAALSPFDNVILHLVERSRVIREQSAMGPQPHIVAIDVSKVVPLRVKREQARLKRARQ